MLKGRTPSELEDKRKKLKKIRRMLSSLAVMALLSLVGLVGYSVYVQYFFEPYPDVKLTPNDSTFWGGGVYKIEVPVDGGKVSCGTGFSIGPQLVLTNAHVVKKKDLIVKLCTDQAKESFRGQVIWVGDYKTNPLNDLAIINIGKPQERSNHYVLPLYRGSELADLEELVAFGFHLEHLNLSLMPGNVTSLSRPDKLIQHNAGINMGFSGGPLVSKKKRQVIGVVVAEEDRAEGGRVVTGIKLAIPIQAALANLPPAYRTYIGPQGKK